MTTIQCKEVAPSGFSFDNCARNDFLEETAVKVPGATKTGIIFLFHYNNIIGNNKA